MYEKLIRQGRVAVIYSPGFGAGWWSWNQTHEGLLFDKHLALLILNNKCDEASELAMELYPGAYISNQKLEIYWLHVGTKFKINEYDGNETVETASDLTHIA